MSTKLRAVVTLFALLAVALTATACSSKSDDDADKPLTIKIDMQGGSVTPNGDRVNAAVGQKIVLDITSDTDGEVHVHSTPEHEYEVPAGHHTYSFTIDKPGLVAVESHTLDKTIVQLVVK